LELNHPRMNFGAFGGTMVIIIPLIMNQLFQCLRVGITAPIFKTVTGEYLGTSGSGPFGWYIYGESFNGINSNESLDKISYQFTDADTEYSCD